MIGIDAQKAAENDFARDHAELLLSFRAEDFRPAMSSWMRLEGSKQITAEDSEDDFYVLLEMCLATLWQRGALVAARPFSSQGQADLDIVCRKYKVTSPEERAAAPIVEEDPFADVVEAHKNLSGAELGKLLRESPGFAERYEEAAVRGRL